MRIFCLTEVVDDILMWSHYADNHRGALIRFRVVPDPACAFDDAQPISYSAAVPTIAQTPEEWMDELAGVTVRPYGELFDRLALTKSQHWSYEREWRCLCGEQSTGKMDGELVSYYPFGPHEVTGLYFGCRMELHQRAELTDLVRQSLPHVEVFQAERVTGAFGLAFHPVE